MLKQGKAGRAGGEEGLLRGKPARTAGSFLAFQQRGSSVSLGQGDILLPFSEAGLSGFQEEDRQVETSIRCIQVRREGSWLEQDQGGFRAWGSSGRNRFTHILGTWILRHFLFLFLPITDSTTQQCTRIFPASSLSTSYSSQHPEVGTTGAALQMKRLRFREEESHAPAHKG